MKKRNKKFNFPDTYHGYQLNVSKFLSRFVEDPQTGCWNWNAAKHRQGYGMISAYRIADDTIIMMTAHRMSWLIYRGPITQPNILHMCHNPACCNPAHLGTGTQKDNMRKMIAAGRQNLKRTARHPYTYNTPDGRHPTFGQYHRTPRHESKWKYRYTPEEIQFLRTASIPEICDKFNKDRTWAYGRRWSARKGYKWLPLPDDK